MGKVIGIAGVGLTQLALWIVLGSVSSMAVSSFFTFSPKAQQEITETMMDEKVKKEIPDDIMGAKVLKALATVDFKLIIGAFVFYFLFGYLMYASLFGAIGSAVDNETDTQQFMLPVTIPLVMSIAMSSAIIADPNGPLAFWMSMIPLTSPVVMMIRLPYIGMGWELLLSMGLLVLGFVGVTWLAGRIYRVGILMYGKKPTYKELAKWVFMK
jgi:ABC-2 type transport system permease protein